MVSLKLKFTKQFLDHDPEAKFVKRWVPELVDRSPAEIANSVESKIPGYATPLVELNQRAKDMKARVFSIRKSQEGWRETQITLRKHGSRKPVRKPRKQKKSGQMQFPI